MVRLASYLEDFERAVIVPGLSQGLFGKYRRVPIDPEFPPKIPWMHNILIQSTEIFAVDYYGLLKRSVELQEMIDVVTGKRRSLNGQVRAVEVPVVFFNSIRYQDILKIDPAFAVDFDEAKQAILELRNIAKNSSVRRRKN